MYEAVKFWNQQGKNQRFVAFYALSFWSSVSPNRNSSITDFYMKKQKDYIKQADVLFESSKYNDVISLLAPYKDSDDVEVLWRLARAEYKLAKNKDISENEKKLLIFSAYAMILKAMELDENNFAVHKWMSVLLDERSAYDGIKSRITQLERVKGHMLRANELNPKDATTLHMLGTWCFGVADMPWLQRKLAATIFVAPPTSTYEEALMYFIKAEEAEPGFYSQNLLMLGKTYLKLKKEDEAHYYLNLAKDHPGDTEEDQQVKKEAGQLLSGLKQKV